MGRAVPGAQRDRAVRVGPPIGAPDPAGHPGGFRPAAGRPLGTEAPLGGGARCREDPLGLPGAAGSALRGAFRRARGRGPFLRRRGGAEARHRDHARRSPASWPGRCREERPSPSPWSGGAAGSAWPLQGAGRNPTPPPGRSSSVAWNRPGGRLPWAPAPRTWIGCWTAIPQRLWPGRRSSAWSRTGRRATLPRGSRRWSLRRGRGASSSTRRAAMPWKGTWSCGRPRSSGTCSERRWRRSSWGPWTTPAGRGWREATRATTRDPPPAGPFSSRRGG